MPVVVFASLHDISCTKCGSEAETELQGHRIVENSKLHVGDSNYFFLGVSCLENQEEVQLKVQF